VGIAFKSRYQSPAIGIGLRLVGIKPGQSEPDVDNDQQRARGPCQVNEQRRMPR